MHLIGTYYHELLVFDFKIQFFNQFFFFISYREQFTANSLKAANKLLQILLLVVQQPGSLGMNLLPHILEFALNSVLPSFMQDPEKDCDVAFSLYSLFDRFVN